MPAKILFLFLSLSFFQAHASTDLIDFENPQFVNNELLLENNDAGQILTMSENQYQELTGHSFMEHLTGFLNFKKSFATVASYITPTLENKFDVFIIINVDHERRYNKRHEVPAQRMKVLRRTKRKQKIFVRNSSGTVIGLQKGVLGNNGQGAFPELSGMMKISSGAAHLSRPGDIYDDSPSGIYRINTFLSGRQRHSFNDKEQAVMFHSMFIDLQYRDGNVSGIALHGTNSSQYKFLGRQKSHGCIRITQAQANSLYENLVVSRKFWGSVPDMDKTKRLKSENGRRRRGAKALFIIFYGYDKSREYQDI